MARASRWTKEEFEILVNSNKASRKGLAQKLPNRTNGAIAVVIEGIHSFHKGKDYGILSKMMKGYLGKRLGSLRCPKCGTAF